jgi:hypothetical protein
MDISNVKLHGTTNLLTGFYDHCYFVDVIWPETVLYYCGNLISCLKTILAMR